MPNFPAVKAPKVRPTIVKTKTDDDGIAAAAVVMTTEVAVVALHVAVKPATLLPPTATAGVTDGMKKPEGYVSVMVPPGGTVFNTVNPTVTGTDILPALRSCAKIKKVRSVMG